jgi:hypothetical protein
LKAFLEGMHDIDWPLPVGVPVNLLLAEPPLRRWQLAVLDLEEGIDASN